MPSKKKKIISIIVLNLTLSLILANKITAQISYELLPKISIYMAISFVSFSTLTFISHKFWNITNKEEKKEIISNQQPPVEKTISKELANKQMKSLKLKRILKKKL